MLLNALIWIKIWFRIRLGLEIISVVFLKQDWEALRLHGRTGKALSVLAYSKPVLHSTTQYLTISKPTSPLLAVQRRKNSFQQKPNEIQTWAYNVTFGRRKPIRISVPFLSAFINSYHLPVRPCMSLKMNPSQLGDALTISQMRYFGSSLSLSEPLTHRETWHSNLMMCSCHRWWMCRLLALME